MRSVLAVALAAGVAVLIGACAKSADKVQAAYVSPTQFKRYSCAELSEEAARMSAEVQRLSGVQDEKATADAVATGVALVVFWPAAFLIQGNGEAAAELSRLKGEFVALESAAKHKGCNIEFRRGEG